MAKSSTRRLARSDQQIMSQPFIIMCAPNGARKNKTDHPALPISDSELADCAESILGEGASIIHLHVRDDSGGHTLDVDRYRSAINAIRQRIGNFRVATCIELRIYAQETPQISLYVIYSKRY